MRRSVVRPSPIPPEGRTPRIGVEVQRRDTEVLTTQLYVPGAPDREDDVLIDERLARDAFVQDDGTLLARFDVVLA